tara:strand:+ start:704 stop:1360 length:657 start_codon:yes stop_codon:yes gene_type:complete
MNLLKFKDKKEDYFYTEESFKTLKTYRNNINILKNLTLDEKSVFIDVGCHRGEELYYLKDIGCKVYAFEVNPLHFNNVKRIYKNYKQIEIYQNAVTNTSGEKIECFYKNTKGKGGSMSIEPGKHNNDKNRKIKVKTIKLSKFIESRDHDIINFIKIDAEGSEFKIIEDLIDSGIIQKVNAIFLEDHSNKINCKKWKSHRSVVVEKMFNTCPEKFYLWE